jgi:hypothetical protein
MFFHAFSCFECYEAYSLLLLLLLSNWGFNGYSQQALIHVGSGTKAWSLVHSY